MDRIPFETRFAIQSLPSNPVNEIAHHFKDFAPLVATRGAGTAGQVHAPSGHKFPVSAFTFTFWTIRGGRPRFRPALVPVLPLWANCLNSARIAAFCRGRSRQCR